MSDIVSRNLLVYPYKQESASASGISFEANNDGSVTIDGILHGFSSIFLHNNRSFLLPKGRYILSLQTDTWNDKRPQLEVLIYNKSVLVRKAAHVDFSTREQEFEITQEDVDNFDNISTYSIQIRLFVQAGTYDNTIVYPMIRDASDPDDTWEPYHPPIHVPDVYFRCTSTAGGAKLEVSYGDEFVGKVLTATNGNKTIRKMAGTSGTVTFTVPESGLWTVSGEVDGATYSVQESVVLDYSVALMSGFDYKSWLIAGGVDPTSYSSLADVLADEVLVRRLMTIHAAVDYLASFQTVNDGLETVINNDICAKWINLRDYALDTLYANSAIAAVMDEADKYFYGEWVIVDNTTTPPTWGPKGCVPIMTSNSAPYGEASASAASSGYEVYKAFDNSPSTQWIAGGSNMYIQYKFINPICIKRAYVKSTTSSPRNIAFKVSNDGSTWSDLGETITIAANAEHTEDFSQDNYWLYVRMTVAESASTAFGTLQFYGRALDVSVPVMTSDTAPYGEAFGDSIVASYSAYHLFDNSTNDPNGLAVSSSASNVGFGYDFKKDVSIKMAVFTPRTGTYSNDNPKDFKIQSYNGISWEDATETITYSGTATKTIPIDQDKHGEKWRLFSITNRGSSATAIAELQFYGVDYSEKEFEVGSTKKWLYDHGVELETIDLTGYSQTGQPTDGTAIKNDDSISQSVVAGSKVKIIGSNTLIDLTPYSVLRMKLRPKTTLINATFGVLASKVFDNDTIAGINYSSSWSLALGVDISSINNNYYLYSRLYGSDGNTTMAQAIDIDEFWLE